MESLSHLGCQAFLSLDMNSVTDEEQLDFNRAIEKRYNKRLKFSGEDNYLNVFCVFCKKRGKNHELKPEKRGRIQ